MATIKVKATKKQLSEAVETFVKWFPEHAETINRNREELVTLLSTCTTIEPAPDSPLALLQSEIELEAQSEAGKHDELEQSMKALSLTPCQEACGVVVVDAIFFALGLLGLHMANKERIAQAVIKELGGEILRSFDRAINAIKDAKGAMKKAKALFELLGQIFKAGGFKAVFKVLKHQMHWWDWLKTGIIAVAQITAWFATGGAAFIGEAALTIMDAEQMIEDIVKAVKACKK